MNIVTDDSGLYAIRSSVTKVNSTSLSAGSFWIWQILQLMIVTCTPSDPVWSMLIQHELLVVLEFDEYCNLWLWVVRDLVLCGQG